MLPAYKPLTVSEFIELINTTFSEFDEIKVIGEVSEFKIRQNKWVFFNLKDDKSVIECFIPLYYLTIALTNGMMVEVAGLPNIYPKSGRFRLKVYTIKPYGEGSILKSFLLLKDKLEKEGLFAAARKRKLIDFPERLGLITSRDSAGYKDFLKIINERMGGLKLYLINVQVQGDRAPHQIIEALKHYSDKNYIYNLDALVLIRGGGSMEDLAIFNNEALARAIFASKIPVVTGIGHEQDITIADLVADLRASTPSNAAQLIIRERSDLLREVEYYEKNISSKLIKHVGDVTETINFFNNLASHFIKDQRSKINNLLLTLTEKIKYLIAGAKSDLKSQISFLKNFNPYAILKRGYSIVYDRNQKPVKSITQLELNQTIKTLLSDGTIESKVKKLFSNKQTLFDL